MKELREFRDDGRLIYRYVEMDPPPRSGLPAPHVISDAMPALEQVDGNWYDSKAKFRAVGRAHGLTEVGNDVQYTTPTSSADSAKTKRARGDAIKRAIDRYKAGHRPGGYHERSRRPGSTGP